MDSEFRAHTSFKPAMKSTFVPTEFRSSSMHRPDARRRHLPLFLRPSIHSRRVLLRQAGLRPSSRRFHPSSPHFHPSSPPSHRLWGARHPFTPQSKVYPRHRTRPRRPVPIFLPWCSKRLPRSCQRSSPLPSRRALPLGQIRSRRFRRKIWVSPICHRPFRCFPSLRSRTPTFRRRPSNTFRRFQRS